MPISVTLSELISDEYLLEQKRLHTTGYGERGGKWGKAVFTLARQSRVKTVLDYGCGQAGLSNVLGGFGPKFTNYDPAVERFAAMPEPADLVVCTDVLEHIEEEKIDRVLWHLRQLTILYLFTVISLVETKKTLSDGRQAHILMRPIPWWVEMITFRGFVPVNRELENPKPEKQFVQVWSPR